MVQASPAAALPLTGRPQTSPIPSIHFRVAATNCTHEGVTAYEEKKMRAMRPWKVVGAKHHHSSVEQLQLDLRRDLTSIPAIARRATLDRNPIGVVCS